MRIIGIAKHAEKYICEVSHTELEKYLNLYYGKLKQVSVGDVIDLSAGYDYAREIKEAASVTKELIQKNRNIIDGILKGFSLLGEQFEKKE